MVVLLVPFVACLIATWHDVRTREVPDTLSAILAVTGIGAAGLGWVDLELLLCLVGGLLGFLIVLPFTLSGGIGGGDLKLVTALGTWLGPRLLLQTLFWTALAGLVFAAVAKARKQKDFAYVPAITSGLLIAVIFPGLLPGLVSRLQSVMWVSHN